MKKIISTLMLFSLISSSAMADCDWTQIKKNPDNTYTYSEQLNLCVGKLVQTNKTQAAQIADLTNAVNLKDLALTKSDQRTQLWMTTSDQLTDRVTKIDQEYKHNEWLYFGLGILTTFAAGYVAGQIYRH